MSLEKTDNDIDFSDSEEMFESDEDRHEDHHENPDIIEDIDENPEIFGDIDENPDEFGDPDEVEEEEKPDRGYFYPKLLSNEYGSYQIKGKTALQEKLPEGIVDIKSMNSYSLINRVFRKTKEEEPFYFRPFSNVARNPELMKGKTSRERIILAEVANERDIKKLRSGFTTALGKIIPFRFEFLVKVKVNDEALEGNRLNRLLSDRILPFIAALNETINERFIFEQPVTQMLRFFDLSEYCFYGYGLMRTIYELNISLFERVLSNEADLATIFMVQTLESILYYCLNGSKIRLPRYFMSSNGIVLSNNFLYIPRRIFDTVTLNLSTTRLAVDFESNEMIKPHPSKMKSHPFPIYFEYLENVSVGIEYGSAKLAILSFLFLVTEEVEEVIVKRIKRKRNLTEDQLGWLELYLDDEFSMGITRFRALLEIGRTSKQNIFKPERIITIGAFAAELCENNLEHLPFSRAARGLLLKTFPENLSELMVHEMMESNEVIFEYWFEDSDPNWDKLRIVDSRKVCLEKIKISISRNENMDQFLEILNADAVAVNDWFNRVQDKSIVPFQMTNLKPEAYPSFEEEINKITKRHPVLAQFLGFYDEMVLMDRYVLIWCLKSMIKRTYPKRMKRVKWKPTQNHRKEHFAAALFITYLVLKSQDRSMINRFFNRNDTFGRWDVTKGYMKALGVIKDNPVTLRKKLDLDAYTKMVDIQNAYSAEDSESLKKILDY